MLHSSLEQALDDLVGGEGSWLGFHPSLVVAGPNSIFHSVSLFKIVVRSTGQRFEERPGDGVSILSTKAPLLEFMYFIHIEALGLYSIFAPSI